MKKIKLFNGAIIYAHGEAKRFFMAGVHGEERASVMALNTLLRDNLEDVWILPCLNRKGFEELNRFHGKYNLNSEFKPDTKLEFMKQLMDIVENERPKLFVDMHEDVELYFDYIWTTHDNDFNDEVRLFCKKEDIGLLYCPEKFPEVPDVNRYVGDSENWARKICPAFTTETAQYNSFNNRVRMNRKYFEFFMGVNI